MGLFRVLLHTCTGYCGGDCGGGEGGIIKHGLINVDLKKNALMLSLFLSFFLSFSLVSLILWRQVGHIGRGIIRYEYRENRYSLLNLSPAEKKREIF